MATENSRNFLGRLFGNRTSAPPEAAPPPPVDERTQYLTEAITLRDALKVHIIDMNAGWTKIIDMRSPTPIEMTARHFYFIQNADGRYTPTDDQQLDQLRLTTTVTIFSESSAPNNQLFGLSRTHTLRQDDPLQLTSMRTDKPSPQALKDAKTHTNLRLADRHQVEFDQGVQHQRIDILARATAQGNFILEITLADTTSQVVFLLGNTTATLKSAATFADLSDYYVRGTEGQKTTTDEVEIAELLKAHWGIHLDQLRKLDARLVLNRMLAADPQNPNVTAKEILSTGA